MSSNYSTLDAENMDSKMLFEYSQVLRDRYLEQLAKIPWEEVVKNRGASFDSIRNIFLHTVDAEDLLVNCAIRRKYDEQSARRDPNKFHDLDSIRKRVEEVESDTKAYVAKLNARELGEKVEMPRRDGTSLSLRVEDVLVHAALENINHFGELIALLWQIDVEPPHLGWISYLQR